MAENMTKKQLESSEIQTGACHYCGQVYQLETDGRATEEQLDKWAEEKCDCRDARVKKKRKERAVTAKFEIENLFGEQYTEACRVLKTGIDLITDEKASKIVIDTGDGVKLSVSMNTKGILKAEIAKSVKKSREI